MHVQCVKPEDTNRLQARKSKEDEWQTIDGWRGNRKENTSIPANKHTHITFFC